ncbi:MAG TPA: LLM class flavin-dependent oxidoreductase, partial [Acidimicrobiales bacterium]|nr:LLM class flavin-dependent oxidoreductase [Acidimicrobiales bacterium]
RMWSEDVIEHHGDFYDFGPMKFEPKPLQKQGIPIEVGGSSAPALQRAGRLGDGWIEAGARSFERLSEMLEVVHAFRREAGRHALPFEVTCGLGRTVDDARRSEDVGVTRITVGPAPHGDVLADPSRPHARLQKQDFTDFTKRFADDVIAKV